MSADECKEKDYNNSIGGYDYMYCGGRGCITDMKEIRYIVILMCVQNIQACDGVADDKFKKRSIFIARAIFPKAINASLFL
ncbi:MAG: hypothetical protein E7266_03700 [Lachnospiraceae bacterium]|nr:hypothetical protein [Lachnospiraceae bacterium]